MGACRANARAFADNEALLGVVGTYYSDCTKLAVPILNTAPGGPIPIVSPLNVDVCLTEPSPAMRPDRAGQVLPVGGTGTTRGWRRTTSTRRRHSPSSPGRLGRSRVFVLSDREAYGVGIARHFRNAARRLGLQVVGSASWDPKASSYAALLRDVARSGADALFLGGIADQGGARLIREKVAVLGSNEGKVKLIAPDGFAEQSLLDDAAGAARGLYVVAPGVALGRFGRPGRQFARRSGAERLGGAAVDPYAVHGAEAIRVLLGAIAASDGTRRDVLAKLFRTKVSGGLLGVCELSENGDPAQARRAGRRLHGLPRRRSVSSRAQPSLRRPIWSPRRGADR